MKRTISLLSTALVLAAVVAASAETQKAIDVKVTGSGKPVILIPGLASPGEVWADTVKHLQSRYQCHVVTIAGFGEMPAVKTETLLDDARDQLVAYVRAQKLEKPAIIGHSLGGTIAVDIAQRFPELPGRIVTVDSIPFIAGIMMPGVTDAATAKQRAGAMRSTIGGQSPEQFAKYQLEVSIPAMVTKPEDVRRIAELCGKSDPAAAGQAMAELMGTDLRGDLGKITCPLLVLGALADKVAYVPREAVEQNFRSQYANAKQARFRFFETAKHFIMIDDPAGFHAALDQELSGR